MKFTTKLAILFLLSLAASSYAAKHYPNAFMERGIDDVKDNPEIMERVKRFELTLTS